jgi:GNAT superfamily N-acetyltransferase
VVTPATIRPLCAADRAAYRTLLGRMSAQDLRFRFFHALGEISEREVTTFVELPDGAIGLAAESEGALVGAGHAFPTEQPGVYELAVVVDPAWRHHGIAGALLDRILVELRGRNAVALTALSLARNNEFAAVAREHGLRPHATAAEITEWRFDLSPRC